MQIYDADSHLFERPELWSDYIDPAQRHHALSIENDELGHPWLTWNGRRLMLTWISEPDSYESIGQLIDDHRAGRLSSYLYERDLPDSHWNPSVRRDLVDEWGMAGSVCFPQWGINWELWLGEDLEALRANMGAWNRWAAEVRQEGRGRLHPVGHVTLRGDLDWLDRQLSDLAAAGIGMALMSTALVDGKRLSHPDLDRAWELFVQHGVTPTLHVGGTSLTGMIDRGWIDNDDIDYMPMLSFPLHGVDAQLAISDLVLNGVCERHPDLRFAVVELLSRWLPDMAYKLDAAHATHGRISGHRIQSLSERPSDYLRRNFRVSAFASEKPGALMEQMGPMLMFGGDFPHPEGHASPYADYSTKTGETLTPEVETAFYGGNVAELLKL
jgi:predicted TIM-barrel fold metal-dependent hydrolase